MLVFVEEGLDACTSEQISVLSVVDDRIVQWSLRVRVDLACWFRLSEGNDSVTIQWLRHDFMFLELFRLD